MGSVPFLESKPEAHSPANSIRGQTKKYLMDISAVLLLSMPFLFIGYSATRALYLSHSHAYYIERSLVLLSRKRVELIGFAYPPAPSLLLVLCPTPLCATVLSSMAGGATIWVLWKQITKTDIPRTASVLMILAGSLSSTFIYLSTESMGEIYALLLFLLAWIYYLQFTRRGITISGFKAGFVLAVAFFFSHYALLYAIPYILFTPMFTKERTKGAKLAASTVVGFPIFVAFLTWVYLNWIFTGDPFNFLHVSGSSLFVFGHPELDTAPSGWQAALSLTIKDLLNSPFYTVVLVVMFFESPAGLLVLLSLPFLVTAVRAHGMYYPEYLAISTYTVLAIAAIPRKSVHKLWPVFLIAMIINLIASFAVPIPGGGTRWVKGITTGYQSPDDLEEVKIAQIVSSLPKRSILLNDEYGYRIIARADTAEPFLLPEDPIYPLAASHPDLFVEYCLEPKTGPGPATTPHGFEKELSFPNWTLYKRVTKPSFPFSTR